MPTWGEILAELTRLKESGTAPAGSHLDVVRRKYLASLAAVSKRSVILYATRWTQGRGTPDELSITPEDVTGFMEVVHGLPDDGLDLILHSPGGSAEATEALVTYLRSKFRDIRVIVPHAAMSAATMLSCAANRIVMGKHSFIGPIDPQFIVQGELGVMSVPAHAILEQFALAKQECANPALLPAWLPMLRQYGPALIVQCQLAMQLAETLVADWLATYMFAGAPDGGELAAGVARSLANHAQFRSHGRFIGRDQATKLGLRIEALEADQALQDAVLSVFHATVHTFTQTRAAKLIENHQGKAFIKLQPGPVRPSAPGGGPATPPGGA